MYFVAPENDWLVRPELDQKRADRPRAPATPNEVIRRVVVGVLMAAPSSEISLFYAEPCNDSRHRNHFRYGMRIGLPAETLDLLINGRAGHRAQYYLSPEIGKSFNDEVVRSLVNVVRDVHGSRDDWRDAEQSLSGAYSKLYVVGDRE